ncbi:hypothetical protein F5884DRAFT_855055 [Xylogone sp. PMI_703]|nr:hypothetical protein F5884DRAFT_855055 [Xylogone sp. PMI_703]
MSQITPKRIILKCREQYLQDQSEMVTAFFCSLSLETPTDYYLHICYDLSSPSSLFLVFDLFCKQVPDVDVGKLEPRVFKVKRNSTFVFHDLGDVASKQAQPRSLALPWGTDTSNQTS